MRVVLHFHVLFLIALEIVMFQVFQLTALVIHGPAIRGKSFKISRDRVAIKQENMRGVVLCARDFVRNPHLRQRHFFSKSGVKRLSESVAIADSIMSSLFMTAGVLWRQAVQAKFSLICVPFGIELSFAAALTNTPVSDGIMVEPLGAKQHQGQRREFQISSRGGASNMCQLLRLLLVPLDIAKFVLP